MKQAIKVVGYTPGPWVVSDSGVFDITTMTGKKIAAVLEDKLNRKVVNSSALSASHSECIANSILIAAVPEISNELHNWGEWKKAWEDGSGIPTIRETADPWKTNPGNPWDILDSHGNSVVLIADSSESEVGVEIMGVVASEEKAFLTRELVVRAPLLLEDVRHFREWFLELKMNIMEPTEYQSAMLKNNPAGL